MLRCRARNARGKPCGSPPGLVDPSTRLCSTHAPGGIKALRERGQKGAEVSARVRQRRRPLTSDELPPLRTPDDAERWTEVVGRAVAERRLTASEGRTVASLLREFLAAHKAGAQAKELTKLRQQVDALRKRHGLRVG